MDKLNNKMTIIRSELLEFIALLNDELATRKEVLGLSYLEGWSVVEPEGNENGLSTVVSLCYLGEFVGCIPSVDACSEFSLEVALIRMDLVIAACHRFSAIFEHKVA